MNVPPDATMRAAAWDEGEDCQLLGSGPVAQLEARLSSLFGMRYVVCVANGTLGLLAAAMAAGLARREVIVPALAYGASLAGLLHLGARLRVADVDPDTLTIDVAAARAAVTAKTFAMLAIDLFGIPSDTAGLRELADDCGVLYLADAAQAFGATCRGRPASVGADAVVLSFTTGKVLAVGEGGAVLTNRRDLYERVVWYTQHPYRQRRDLGLHVVNPFGLNARMHPSAARLALARIDHALERLDEHRAAVAQARRVIEENNVGSCLPVSSLGLEPTYFRLPVRLAEGARAERVVEILRRCGCDAWAEPEAIRPFYQHPAFLAQYARRARLTGFCRAAEDAVRHVVVFGCRREGDLGQVWSSGRRR